MPHAVGAVESHHGELLFSVHLIAATAGQHAAFSSGEFADAIYYSVRGASVQHEPGPEGRAMAAFSAGSEIFDDCIGSSSKKAWPFSSKANEYGASRSGGPRFALR
jgi:hypothetical protein